jgi:hypothetical protein
MTDDANGNWRDEIIDKIIALCSVENAAKACLYLALDEAKYNNDYTNAPSWKMLHSLRENDSVSFSTKKYLKQHSSNINKFRF